LVSIRESRAVMAVASIPNVEERQRENSLV
jgi:hypothetical protein